MTDERPLVEGIDAYHESLREGARRERKRILKLIDSKGNFDFENESLPEYCKTLEQKAYYRYGYWDALKELKEELKK